MPTCPSSDQSDGKTHQRRSRASRGCGVTSSRSLGARARASGTDSASSSMYLASDPSKSGVTVLTLGHIQDEGARVHTRPRVRVRARSPGGGCHQEGDDCDATAPAECTGTGHADASVCSALSTRMRQLFGEQRGSCNSVEHLRWDSCMSTRLRNSRVGRGLKSMFQAYSIGALGWASSKLVSERLSINLPLYCPRLSLPVAVAFSRPSMF